jgi:hypothetical protein
MRMEVKPHQAFFWLTRTVRADGVVPSHGASLLFSSTAVRSPPPLAPHPAVG